MTTPREIISYLLPFVVTAGTYSARIQGGVATHDAKAGETPFHHALSDADLTIQSYLEVVLLARYPELHFFSEEQEQSLNAKYFSRQLPLEVLLDPIDGTRSYIDNRAEYQIIITIHDEREIVGVLCYLPRKDRCYIASKGDGAFALTHAEALSGSIGTRLKLSHTDGPVLLFNAPDVVRQLSPHFEVKDLVETYTTAPGQYDSTDLITGRASAVVQPLCQAIDGGAMAFIAAEAGAIMTHYDGSVVKSFRTSPKRTIPEVVVSVNKDVHERLLAALRQ